MKNEQTGIDLAVLYMEERLGQPIRDVHPVGVTPMQVAEFLWPLNDIFRPHIHRIRTIQYRANAEQLADRAIEAFAWAPRPHTWADLSGATWRVLLERHQQLIETALANAVAGRQFMTHLPVGLPEDARLPALMLLLLHGMKLPFPVHDRSRLELPEAGPDQSLQPH